MEFQKITNFLDVTSDNEDLPKFATKKWIEVYGQSEGNYNVDKEIRIKTSMLSNTVANVNANNSANNNAFVENNWFLKIMHRL